MQKAGKASVDEEDMYNESGVQMFDEVTNLFDIDGHWLHMWTLKIICRP